MDKTIVDNPNDYKIVLDTNTLDIMITDYLNDNKITLVHKKNSVIQNIAPLMLYDNLEQVKNVFNVLKIPNMAFTILRQNVKNTLF